MRSVKLLVIIVISLFTACSKPSEVPGEFIGLPHEGWEYGKVLSFNTDGDTIGHFKSLDFSVRHTNDYPYANLWVEIAYKAVDSVDVMQPVIGQDGEVVDSVARKQARSVAVTDTFDIRLADDFGKWLGSGSGPSIQHTQGIELSRTPAPGSKFDVRHIMRVDRVMDIEQIGLTFRY